MGEQMHNSPKAAREAREIALHYRVWKKGLLAEELLEEKLSRLLEFIGKLEETPAGSAELKHRIKLFGKCRRINGETSGQFYGKLRHWLDRDMPRQIAPRNPERLD